MSLHEWINFREFHSNGATTLSIITLSIMPFSIMTLSIKGLLATLSINGIKHKLHSYT